MKAALLIIILLVARAHADEPKPEAPKKDPDSEYLDAIDAARLRYLARIADRLSAADELEVSLLGGTKTKPDQDAFSNAERSYYIVERRVINGDAMQPWLQAIQGTLRNAQPNGILCHDPIHGIKLWKRAIVDGGESKELLFETTLCWRCGNFSASLPAGGGVFAFPDRNLRDLCTALIPIPEPKPNAPK